MRHRTEFAAKAIIAAAVRINVLEAPITDNNRLPAKTNGFSKMLLARLFGWIKAHQTFHVFLLEVLAVFIGISASLIVDDWRQARVDREILENLLQEIHANAIVGQGVLELNLFWNNQALASAVLLAEGRCRHAVRRRRCSGTCCARLKTTACRSTLPDSSDSPTRP